MTKLKCRTKDSFIKVLTPEDYVLLGGMFQIKYGTEIHEIIPSNVKVKLLPQESKMFLDTKFTGDTIVTFSTCKDIIALEYCNDIKISLEEAVTVLTKIIQFERMKGGMLSRIKNVVKRDKELEDNIELAKRLKNDHFANRFAASIEDAWLNMI